MPIVIPDVAPGEGIRVSATTYVVWKRCPDQANARLQGKYGPDTRHAFVGSLAHRIFSRHLNNGPVDYEDFTRVCREEIGGSALNNKLADLEIKPSSLAGVIEEVRDLYARFTKLPGEGFEGAEVDLGVEAGDGVELAGKVDAVYREDTGGHRLVDWKTGELGEPEDQLLFYALLWAMGHDDLPAYVEAVSVRSGERYRTVPSRLDVERVASEVASLVDEMRRAWRDGERLERRAGPWCGYCPILEECEEGQSVVALLG